MNSLARPLITLCLAAAACGAPVRPKESKPIQVAPESAPAVPALRLPGEVRPLRYRAELRVIPSAPSFSGRIDISLSLKRETSHLWLNGAGLRIKEARAGFAGASIAARAQAHGDGQDFIGVVLSRPIGPGEASLHILYEAPIHEKESTGVFRQRDGADFYAYTDFEPTDARRAFPCFDEPSFKVPWQLTLHVPREHLAVSNTGAVSETEEGDGLKTVRFAETKPLPSYLVAFAVGPFDVVPVKPDGVAGRARVPVRIITPRGMANQAQHAAEITPTILALLEDYFDIPYPFDKMDFIAVEHLGGAMENAGLVTFKKTLLLSRSQDDTISRRRAYASVAAHELAHQWFGNLVTLAYWDDIWLNESFASWMDGKIIDSWKPEWDGRVTRVFSRAGAMGVDSLVSARRIRQPIESKNDIINAFDGITYSKGEAVLGMFEAWIGAEPFRRGIRRYLQEHAYGNATAQDFLQALSVEAGRDAAVIRDAFSTFLDQPGVPLVSAALRCEKGHAPALTLRQKRYLPLGSTGSMEQRWHIPICIKHGAGKGSGRECLLFKDAEAEVQLVTPACPEWILPNEGATGYYRVHYQGDLLRRLLQHGGAWLSLPERVSVLSDLSALVRTGEIEAGEALALIPLLVRDRNRHIVSGTLSLLGGLHNLVPDEVLPDYARFIRKVYGQHARSLGFRSREGESEDTRLLRPQVVGVVGDRGEDPVLIAEAGRLARAWLKDRGALDAEMVPVVLRLAARGGDRALFARYREEASRTRESKERTALLDAMGAFRDESIVKDALGLLLSEEFDIREARGILHAAFDERRTMPLAYEFLKANFDRLVERLPRDAGAYLPAVTSYAFCDEAARKDVARFFEGRSTRYTGGPRILAQTLERIDLCSAFKRAQQPSVVAFFRKS